MDIKLIVRDAQTDQFTEIDSIEKSVQYVKNTIERKNININKLEREINARACIKRMSSIKTSISTRIFLNILLYLENEVYLEIKNSERRKIPGEIYEFRYVLKYINEEIKLRNLKKGDLMRKANLSPGSFSYWASNGMRKGPQLKSILAIFEALELEFIINSERKIHSIEEAKAYVEECIQVTESEKLFTVKLSHTFLYVSRKIEGMYCSNFIEIITSCGNTITIGKI